MKLVRKLSLALLFLISAFSYSVSDAAIINKPTNNLGMVGYWTFDGADMTPNVRDKSGQGNHGNLFGQTSTTTTQGKIGQALILDGLNDYISVTDHSSLDITSAITISAWVKYNTSAPAFGEIVHKSHTSYSAPYGLYALQSNNNGIDVPRFCLSVGGVENCHAAQNSLTNGEWVHIAATYDGSEQRIYTNGSLNGSPTSLSGSIDTNDVALNIGRNNNNVEYYNDAIDEVRIYNRALSATEITKLYNQSSAKFITSQPSGTLSTDLVGHWTFDGKDLTPNIRDISGLANHGNLNNQATTTVGGRIGQAISFDGVDDNISVANSDSLNITTDKVTVSAWVKGVAPGIDKAIVFKSSAAGSVGYGLQTGSSGNARFFIGNGAFRTTADVGNIVWDGQWHHLVGTYDGANVAIYVDGVFNNQAAFTGNISSSASLSLGIGSRQPAANYFPGLIDDVRIYSKALSAAEIRQLYNAGVQKVGVSATSTPGTLDTGLVAYWPFDGRNMTPNIRDISGLSNHGNLSGQTSTTTAPGVSGQALTLDGVDDTIEVNAVAGDIASGSFTIAGWVRLSQPHTSTSAGKGIFQLGDVPSTNDIRFCFLGSTGNTFCAGTAGRVCFSVYTGSAFQSACSSQSSWNVGQWYHVAAVMNTVSGGQTLYIDGASAGTNSNTTRGGTAAALARLGSHWNNANATFFPGNLDDFRVYNRALTASEVKQLYNMGR